MENRMDQTPPFLLISWKTGKKRIILGPEDRTTLDSYFRSRSLEIATRARFDLDLVLSRKPVFVEASRLKIFPASVFYQFGFFGKAEEVEEIDTPRVPSFVYNLIDSTDIKAEEAVLDIYRKTGDVEYAARVLSTGQLGLKFQRKEVPTRWAISAVDSTISRRMIEKIKSYKILEKIEIYSGERWGNRYFVVFLPGTWAFELLEVWLPGAAWGSGIISDFEIEKPKTEEPKTAGSYYATRLAVVEKLLQKRRVARVIVFREVTSDYYFPAGVWNVREGVRGVLKGKPRRFDTLKEALGFIGSQLLEKKLIQSSRLVRIEKEQTKLTKFLA